MTNEEMKVATVKAIDLIDRVSAAVFERTADNPDLLHHMSVEMEAARRTSEAIAAMTSLLRLIEGG